MSIEEIKKKTAPIFKEYGVEYAGVFGSVARGDDTEKSDVDLLVQVKNIPYGIWGFVGLKDDLQKALNKKVDVVSDNGIATKFKERIKKELISIYEKRS